MNNWKTARGQAWLDVLPHTGKGYDQAVRLPAARTPKRARIFFTNPFSETSSACDSLSSSFLVDHLSNPHIIKLPQSALCCRQVPHAFQSAISTRLYLYISPTSDYISLCFVLRFG